MKPSTLCLQYTVHTRPDHTVSSQPILQNFTWLTLFSKSQPCHLKTPALCLVVFFAILSVMSVVPFRDRTVVFSLSRGVQVSPTDFLPYLTCVQNRMVGFGTVGVGHVWHLTLVSEEDAELLEEQGDFTIKNRQVSVSRLKSNLLTATIYWLPFWVPHDDVVDSLQALLDDRVTCTYIQIPQHGFHGCYSTQRKIRSPVDLKDLPYFIDITSEGRVYRAFLFVPGRPAVCFDCGHSGHMKNACPGVKKPSSGFKRPSDPVDIPYAKKQTIEEGDEAVSSVASHSPQESDMVLQEYSRSPGLQALLNIAKPEQLKDAKYRYKIVLVQGDKSTVLTSKGNPIEVIPPDVSSIPSEQTASESRKCSATNCRMVGHWSKRKISITDMVTHLDAFHGDLLHLERY